LVRALLCPFLQPLITPLREWFETNLVILFLGQILWFDSLLVMVLPLRLGHFQVNPEV
jgi:hypothetical protein